MDTVFRYFGSSRYETSLKVADAYKKKMEIDKFSSVILAYGNNYADALAGSYLSAMTSAPILLVDAKQDHINAVQAYIKENLRSDGTIYLLGGAAVVPDAAVKGLTGYTVKRLGGSDRYATNLKVLEEGRTLAPWYTYEVIVASGKGFADSLSAAASGAPILLVKGKELTKDQKAYLESVQKSNEGFMMITVIGGEGAVSNEIFNQLKTYGEVFRVGGQDRYETSRKFAEYYFGGVTGAVVAYGANFPDGLCGGSLANAMGGPLLLSANNKSAQAAAYAKANGIKGGAVLGGPTLISDADAKTIFSMSSGTMIKVIS